MLWITALFLLIAGVVGVGILSRRSPKGFRGPSERVERRREVVDPQEVNARLAKHRDADRIFFQQQNGLTVEVDAPPHVVLDQSLEMMVGRGWKFDNRSTNAMTFSLLRRRRFELATLTAYPIERLTSGNRGE
jgi:hypothetical protein